MKTNLHLIPVPKKVTPADLAEAALLTVKPLIEAAHAPFSSMAAVFSEMIEKAHDVRVESGKGGVTLELDPSLAEGEYRIECTDGSILAYAADEDGISYALASLFQLMKPCEGGLTMPCVAIKDQPDCAYRSLMVDLARQWHPFDTLFAYVDLCWLYKIKFLHLHFIDSQSYTLPSDVLPGISTPGRHYTKEQIALLRAYAAGRSVEIIPEFEVPGHGAAMISAYPELFANTPVGSDKPKEQDNLLCVGKPGVMENIRRLLQEIVDMFPESRYIHIGGDEAEIDQWNDCADCLRYMKENHIDGVHALYTHCVKLVSDMVLDMGRTPIVWEGFPKEGTEDISRKVIVIAWESYYHLAPDLIEEGFDIINCAWQPLYITPNIHWNVEDILAWNVCYWPHWWPKSVAHLNPIHIQPTKQVLGGQLCAWEWNYQGEINYIKENLAALSERTWNLFRTDEDAEFRRKLYRLLPLADRLTPDFPEDSR